jgi:hypothetical protein
VKAVFVKKTIISNYGNPKPYLVHDVLFDANPYKIMFLPLGSTDEISVGTYY